MSPLRYLLPALALASSAALSAQTDTTPPSVPVNFAGTAASSTAIVLYWTQSEDDAEVPSYEIYRDDVLLLTHTDNTFTDTGLAPGSAHTYRVAARDAAGNVSARSAEVTVTTDTAENPRLVRPAHLSYRGAFRLPPRDDRNNYSYGGDLIAFNPANNSLFARGHSYAQRVGELAIPLPLISTDPNALPVAAILQNQAEITEGNLGCLGADGADLGGVTGNDAPACRLGGLLVHEGRLIGTSFVYYDSGFRAVRSHFASGLDLAQTGDFSGMSTVGNVNPGFVAGFMAVVPPEWRAALGGSVLTGQAGLAIITRTSMGPAAAVFNPAALGVADQTPAQLLLGYPDTHPTLGNWDNEAEPNPQYDMSTYIRGLVFPAGSDSVLFFGTAGTGTPRYGIGTADPSLDGQEAPNHPGVIYAFDPIDLGKGCHAYPYTAFVWAYRAQDLARVAAGTAQPWQIVPYATWPITLPCGFNGADIIGGAAYDPATNRLFLSHYNAAGSSHDKPIIHVYNLELPVAPPTYTAWRAANFTGVDLTNDAISGPAADPDCAGVTNLQRYAFALPARGPVANPVTLSTADTAAGRVLTLTFPRRAEASDLTYTLEASTDLATWAAVPDRTSGPGVDPITAEDVVPLDEPDTPRRFLRLRVATP